MQREDVSEDVQAEGVEPGFVPEQHWNGDGQHKAHNWHQKHVVLVLEPDDGVCVQIGNVDFLPLLNDARVLAHQQPSHVGEEEPALGVMGISVCFRELVMDAMVSGPFNY